MLFTLFNVPLSGPGNPTGTTADVFETVNAAVEDAPELIDLDKNDGSSGSCLIA
ncbi:hypothetical protein GGX14DRAFT_577253 [Mycena pura]|uniref:Uncharacterized protein n=1 Tax=Mycena pura TaxID=153505 RepID=A0AAD6UVG3_9AGAR|nr:hypothetical protein GGX14DRAFT_577253 [Mycena pura]